MLYYFYTNYISGGFNGCGGGGGWSTNKFDVF
jgi:hypothetical protein